MKFFKRFNLPGKASVSPSLITPVVVACFVTAAAYQLFFYWAPFIWSLNSKLPVLEYMPMARGMVEAPRGGMQIYALYALMYLIPGVSFLIYSLLNKISDTLLWRGFIFLFALPCILFFREVGFTPPVAEYSYSLAHDSPGILFILSVLGVTTGLSFFANKPLILAFFLAVFLFPICMVASSDFSATDYNFILFPALRILHGFPLNKIWFQYDHFLSFLAVLWMRLGFSFYDFSCVGQFSVYAFFMGLYFFGRHFFAHKYFALYLLISAVLVRMYGNIADIILCFQVTPLRLDWWFLVLMAVFYKGEAHWLTGMTLGFLLVLHHAFGVIYTLAYAAFILFLFGMDVVSKKVPFESALRCFWVLYAKNIMLIGFSFLLYHLFFACGQSSSSVYRQHGIGFMPILKQSFYWYVPVLLSFAFIVNLRNRPFLPERYFRAGFFLILLAIGNSLYFFGRSHENNIVNISSILLFCLFFLFDRVQSECERLSSSRFSKWVLPVLAVAFIVGISYAYAGRAPARVLQQVKNFRTPFVFGRSLRSGLDRDLSVVKKWTHSSPNLTFVCFEDGYYYYEGGYVPRYPYSVTDPRLLLVKDSQDLFEKSLRDGHYLVMPLVGYNNFAYGEILSRIRAQHVKVNSEMIVVSDNPIG